MFKFNSKELKCLIIFIFIAFSNTIYAQKNYFLVSGKVISDKDKKGIPYVNVYIEGSSFGTITDKDGEYEIKVLPQFKNKFLVFSSLGYQTKKNKINSLLNVSLKEISVELGEVIVKPVDPLTRLRQAIAKMPENYSAEPVYLDAFYRTLMKENNSYVKLIEASCKFHYAPYKDTFNINEAQKSYFEKIKKRNCSFYEGMNNYFDLYVNPEDQVKIIESRISEDYSGLINDLNITGGPLNLIAADKVKYLNSFMDEKHFKHYKYYQNEMTSFNGKDVYVISFKPKRIQFRDRDPGFVKYVLRRKYKNAEFKGKIYIEAESKAIVRIEYSIYSKNSTNTQAPYPYHVRLDYRQIKNKWYLSQILRKRSNRKYFRTVDDTISIEERLIINNVQEEKVVKFSESETFPHSNYLSLFRFPVSYNNEFWNKYNIVTHNKLQQKAIDDLERNKPLEQQFKDMQVRNDSFPMPKAPCVNSISNMHNYIIIDEYKWLENINDEKVKKYIKEENRYTYNYFIPHREKQNTLFKEMAEKLSERKETLYKQKNGEYTYYQKYKQLSDYPVLCRKFNKNESKEEILFDFNTWAEKYDYFDIGFTEISPNNRHIAIGVDKDGSEHMTCFFINIEQKTIKKDSINNIWSLVWANDNKTFFYVLQDSLNRPSSLYKHKLGSDFSKDKLIYYEKDKYFDIGIRKSKLGNYIFLEIGNFTTSELRYISAGKPDDVFRIFYPRENNHNYRVKESEKDFFILSNKNALNNILFKTSKENISYKNWEEIIISRKNTLLDNFYLCNNFLVLSEISDVQRNIRVVDLNKDESEYVKFNEEYYSLNLLEYNYYSDKLQLQVSSFITPPRTYEYNMSSRTIKLLNESKIKNYSPDDYKVERIWCNSSDGTKIPVSLVYKKKILYNSQGYRINKKIKNDGSNPLILEAYGSYGNANFPSFSLDKFCMLDRGFIYAVAHVRGSNAMGKQWHEAAKLLNKKNTFDDYLSCAEYLINERYTDSSLLFGLGGSAGGMLMGVAANRKPELFKGIILEYPQVCQLDALLDSITMNHQEFGNPYKKKDFDYIYSYSPYENIKKQKYPAMLLISGLKDERVRYWQPTKMTARLRKNNLSDSPILLKSYNTGHTGQRRRDAHYRSMAFEYSFYLSLLDNN